MYDPSLGRFIQQDPIGFDAGDTNLYRYVGNNPPTATDPSGLDQFTYSTTPGGGISVLNPQTSHPVGGPRPHNAPFPTAGGRPAGPLANTGSSGWSLELLLNAWGLWTPTEKPTILNAHPFAQQNAPTAIPNPSGPGTNIASLTHWFFPPGLGQQFVGTGGCGGCVAVIIQSPGHGVAVFHFGVTDNPFATIGQYTWPAGSHAIMAGGDNSPESNVLMQNVIGAISTSGITLDGIADSSNCYVGANGTWHIGNRQ